MKITSCFNKCIWWFTWFSIQRCPARLHVAEMVSFRLGRVWSCYNTECLIVGNVFGECDVLYVKDLLCRFRKRVGVLQPLQNSQYFSTISNSPYFFQWVKNSCAYSSLYLYMLFYVLLHLLSSWICQKY